MKRSTWQKIMTASLIILVLLMIFTVGLWALANAAGVLLRLVFILDEDMEVTGIPFSAFMANFVGSPLFYVYMVDLAALTTSAIALFLTRTKKAV